MARCWSCTATLPQRKPGEVGVSIKSRGAGSDIRAPANWSSSFAARSGTCTAFQRVVFKVYKRCPGEGAHIVAVSSLSDKRIWSEVRSCSLLLAGTELLGTDEARRRLDCWSSWGGESGVSLVILAGDFSYSC